MSITKHIPNTITSINLACGAAGVVCVGLGRIDVAFILMLCGALADFCDGLSARALGAYSPIGKELDSLADQISFGLLPAVMLVATMFGKYGTGCLWCWIPLLIAVFSGLRLAKFNVDSRQSTSFIGLPTPACAMVCGALAYLLAVKGDSAVAQALLAVWVIPTLSVVMSALLVCEIPMFSMKMHKTDRIGGRRAAFAAVALAAVAVTLALHWNWSAIVLISFAAYIFINISSYISTRRHKK